MNLVGNKLILQASQTSVNVLNGIPIANLSRPGTVRVRAKQIDETPAVDVRCNLVIGTMSLVNGVFIPSYYVPATEAAGDPTRVYPTLMDADVFDGPVTQAGILELTFTNTAAAQRQVWWEYAITF